MQHLPRPGRQAQGERVEMPHRCGLAGEFGAAQVGKEQILAHDERRGRELRVAVGVGADILSYAVPPTGQP